MLNSRNSIIGSDKTITIIKLLSKYLIFNKSVNITAAICFPSLKVQLYTFYTCYTSDLFAASATVLRRSQWMGKKDDEDHKEEDMDKKEEQDEDCFTK